MKTNIVRVKLIERCRIMQWKCGKSLLTHVKPSQGQAGRQKVLAAPHAWRHECQNAEAPCCAI